MLTGSLQVKNKTYYAVLNFKEKGGKRKQKWINSGISAARGNKRLADQFLKDCLDEYNEDTIAFSEMQVSDYFRQWLTEQKYLVAPNTYRGYAGNMENHIIPYFEGKGILLQNLKPYHLDEYYTHKMGPNGKKDGKGALNPTTIKHHHQNISKALNDAVRKGILQMNPAVSAKTPKARKYIGQFLNPAQLNDLICLFEDTVVELPVKIIATYGLRRSQALGLCWNAVDFVNRQFTISRALLQNNGGDYVQDVTKTESSYRTLPLTAQMETLLHKQQEKQKKMRALMGNMYANSDFVCTWPDGTPITPNYLSRTFHQVIAHSTLPQIRLHDLRHSCASNLLANGFSVVEVQQWLGHSEASTTLNFYSHVDSASKKRISTALDQLLNVENG